MFSKISDSLLRKMESFPYGKFCRKCKWSLCTLWLHLAFLYKNWKKNRENLSDDSRSSGQNVPNGKEKNVCCVCFCSCLLVIVFKDDLTNILLICLDWGTLGCLLCMIWEHYELLLRFWISNCVSKLRYTAGKPSQCRDCSLVNSTYQAEVLTTAPWHRDVRS